VFTIPMRASAGRSSAAQVWARANGLVVADRGRLRPEIHRAWQDANEH